MYYYTPLFTQDASIEEIVKTCIQYVENHPAEFVKNLSEVGWPVYLILDSANPSKKLELLSFAQAIDKTIVPGMSIEEINDNTRKVKTITKVANFLKKTNCSFKGFSAKERAFVAATLADYQESEYPRLATTFAKKELIASILDNDSIVDKSTALKEADSIAYQIAKSGRLEDAMERVDKMTGEELYHQYILVKKQNNISSRGAYTLK